MLIRLVSAIGVATIVASVAAAAESGSLSLERTISLDDVQGRIDHMALDAQRHRLYVAALGNDTVEVVDLAAGKRLAAIRGMQKPQGIRVLPESGTVIVASGDDGKCRFYDGSQQLVATIDDLDDADNVRLDPGSGFIYVGYGDGAIAIIDPQKHQRIGDIKLSGHPESFQLEAGGSRIFVNVPTARQIAVLDRTMREVIATWPIQEAEANFPMALDEKNQRLFVGCRRPAKILVIDAASGRVVSSVGSSGDADDLFFDAAAKRIYVSGGDGTIGVIEQQDADHYRTIESVKTAAGARTSMFDPESRRLYLAVPLRGSQKPEIRVYKAGGA